MTPYKKERWIGTGIIGVLYIIRAVTANGWYVVTVRVDSIPQFSNSRLQYALGIYLLNVFLAFLTPKFDPALEQELIDEDEGPMLPTRGDDEFRPFIRRLPEFKFWFVFLNSAWFYIYCFI